MDRAQAHARAAQIAEDLGHEGDTAAGFDCRTQRRGTIALHRNVWFPIEIREDRFEHLVVFGILRSSISREGLVEERAERHFRHPGEPMLTSYGHAE